MVRIKWIDVARGIAIALVVLGHTRAGEQSKVIYAFHMPLFFLLTGYTFDLGRYRENFAGFARDKGRRLLLPYFVSALFLYALWVLVFRRFGADPTNQLPWAKPLIGILYGNGMPEWMPYNIALWFLPALFVATLLLYGVLRLTESATPWLRIGAVAAAALTGYLISRWMMFPWGVDVALVALPFLLAGYELRDWVKANGDRPLLSPPYVAIAVAAFVLVVLVNARADMNHRAYHNLVLFYLGAFAGSALLLWISQMIARWEFPTEVLSYLGRESLMVLIFHFLGMKVLSALIVFVLRADSSPYWESAWPAYLLFGLLVPLAIAETIKRIPFVRPIYYKTPARASPAGAIETSTARLPPAEQAAD